MMVRKYRLTTLGCKVNQYESQEIREVLSALNWRPARQGEPADVAIVNTCAVTGSASRKNRQAIRRLNDGGKTSVIVVGCGASADAAQLGRINGVRAVLGHDSETRTAIAALLSDWFAQPPATRPPATQPPMGQLPSENASPAAATRHPNAPHEGARTNPQHLTRQSQKTPVPTADNADPARIIPLTLPVVKTTHELTSHIRAFDGHQRAFLKVQDGCDAFCSYCIIPRLRSTLKSKPVEVAVREAEALVQDGHKEIIVTGIFLGAYGRETAIRRRFEPGRAPLATLVQALSRVDGLHRLRLSSLEPGDVTDDLLDVLSSADNCVPHMHLPLQSGSANILHRMNRQYSRDDFVDMVDRVRQRLDRPAITTDIIVGFPGESEADFDATCEIARHAGFSKIHAFPFSPRERTAAARWQKDFVPAPVTRERMHRLTALELELSTAFRRQFVGHRERIIVESWLLHGDDATEPMCYGRSDRYFDIHATPDVASQTIEVGEVTTVRIDRITPTRTLGTILDGHGSPMALPVLGNSPNSHTNRPP